MISAEDAADSEAGEEAVLVAAEASEDLAEEAAVVAAPAEAGKIQ
jgi:hypothetical protein